MTYRQTNETVQLTIRGVPARVKQLLTDRANKEHKSLNTILVELLKSFAGLEQSVSYDDLDELAGLWVEDAEFDSAVAAQKQIDQSIWQ